MRARKLSVSWGDGVVVELKLSGTQWTKIQAGERVAITGSGYSYEGERFQDVWYFNTDSLGSLRVSYDEADGFVGDIKDALP